VLTNEEKIAIADQHLKNLELNAYNVTLSLITENSVTEPNEVTVKLLEEQLSDLNTKIESVNVEKNKLKTP
jgi:TolA-binding protein